MQKSKGEKNLVLRWQLLLSVLSIVIFIKGWCKGKKLSDEKSVLCAARLQVTVHSILTDENTGELQDLK